MKGTVKIIYNSIPKPAIFGSMTRYWAIHTSADEVVTFIVQFFRKNVLKLTRSRSFAN